MSFWSNVLSLYKPNESFMWTGSGIHMHSNYNKYSLSVWSSLKWKHIGKITEVQSRRNHRFTTYQYMNYHSGTCTWDLLFSNLSNTRFSGKKILINHLESVLGWQFEKYQDQVLLYENYYCKGCGERLIIIFFKSCRMFISVRIRLWHPPE